MKVRRRFEGGPKAVEGGQLSSYVDIAIFEKSWTHYSLPSDLELNSLHIDDHSVHKEEDSTEQWAFLNKWASLNKSAEKTTVWIG